jgi:hypothetical protein
MTPQEKDLLTTLLDRLRNAPRQSKDPEADTLIRQALADQPDLPYYLVQTVLIQDLSLHQAQQRIGDLEKQLADAQQAAKPSVGSFLGGLFGSGYSGRCGRWRVVVPGYRVVVRESLCGRADGRRHDARPRRDRRQQLLRH